MEANKFDIIIENNDTFSSYYDENNEQITRLKNASNINIFVGANNSGKSRFIRNLLNYKTFKILNQNLLKKELKSFNEYIESLNFKLRNHSGHVDFINLNSKFIEFQKLDITYDLFNEFENLKIIISHNFRILNLFEKETTKRYLPPNILSNENKNIIKDKIVKIESMLISSIGKEKTIFIPTLRTAHSIFYKKQNSETYTKIADDIFKETIIKNYKIDEEKTEIFTGLTLYNEIVNARNNTKEVRSRFENFEEFISDHFFQGKKIDIVAKLDIYKKNNQNDETELINIYIDGESKDLYELGDGIQALIILMYKIFMCEDNSLIFIDEPEINLHPGMQRLFLEQITNNEVLKKKNITYFISTHSNHFLDLTIEKDNISVFLFNKVLDDDKPKFIVKNVNDGDNSPLQYLGVSNSSVFLANCSIWVEGISDRNYLKAFLKAYCRDNKGKIYPKEDIDFTFIEYAGSNIDHYNFSKDELKEKINAFSLNNKIFLVSDYDGEYRNEKHRFYYSYKHENFTYKTTKPYKEVENLLSLKVWNKILIHFCNKRKIETEENYKNVKSKIQSSLANFVDEKYEDVYIGKFLSEVKKSVPELNKIWHDSEGTIINKAELSKKVLELTENGELTWDDFKSNQKVNNITAEIYNFINKNKLN